MKENLEKLEHTEILDLKNMLVVEQRKHLKYGEWIENQPLKTVQELSSHLLEKESLIVKTVIISPGEIRYNIQLTSEKQNIQRFILGLSGGLITGVLTLYFYKKYKHLNGQKHHPELQFFQTNINFNKTYRYPHNNNNKFQKVQQYEEFKRKANNPFQGLYNEYEKQALKVKNKQKAIQNDMSQRFKSMFTGETKINKLSGIQKLIEDKMRMCKNFVPNLINVFNAQKDFTMVADLGRTTHFRILALQPIYNFESLLTKLLNVRMRVKTFIDVFKHLLAKLK